MFINTQDFKQKAELWFDDFTVASALSFIALGALFIATEGPFTRVALFPLLSPHATKLIAYSLFTLFVLRPRFKWKAGFALLLTYGLAEYVGNLTFVALFGFDVYAQINPDWWFTWGMFAAFAALGYVIARPQFHAARQMLAYPTVVGLWLMTGYHTDIIPHTSINLLTEAFEFISMLSWLLFVAGLFGINVDGTPQQPLRFPAKFSKLYKNIIVVVVISLPNLAITASTIIALNLLWTWTGALAITPYLVGQVFSVLYTVTWNTLTKSNFKVGKLKYHYADDEDR
jgi:hypothetical protein